MAKVLNFPRAKVILPLDWEKIEQERLLRFPKVPKTALKILKKVVEGKGTPSVEESDSFLQLDIPDNEGYEYLKARRRCSFLVWRKGLLQRWCLCWSDQGVRSRGQGADEVLLPGAETVADTEMLSPTWDYNRQSQGSVKILAIFMAADCLALNIAVASLQFLLWCTYEMRLLSC